MTNGAPDDDTTYNSTATIGQSDLFICSQLPTTPVVIRSVSAVVYSKKDDVGVRQIAALAKSGATQAQGPTIRMVTL